VNPSAVLPVMASYDPFYSDPSGWFDALWGVYADPLGPVLPLMLGFGLVVALTIASDSIAPAAITGVVIAGITVPYLPGAVQGYAMLAIMVSAAIALWLTFTRSVS